MKKIFCREKLHYKVRMMDLNEGLLNKWVHRDQQK